MCKTILQCIIKILQELTGFTNNKKNILVDRLLDRLRALCSNQEAKHTTLLNMYGGSIISLLENYARFGKEQKKDPIVDGTDVQNVFLVLPFVLCDLVSTTQVERNWLEKQSKKIWEIIGVVCSWLGWHMMYRSSRMNEDMVNVFHRRSIKVMQELQRVLVCHDEKGNPVNKFKTEKFHSICHAAQSRVQFGQCDNFSAQPTEMMHRYTREDAELTNRHHGFTKCILKRKSIQSCCKRLANQHDKSGLYSIHYNSIMIEIK